MVALNKAIFKIFGLEVLCVSVHSSIITTGIPKLSFATVQSTGRP